MDLSGEVGVFGAHLGGCGVLGVAGGEGSEAGRSSSDIAADSGASLQTVSALSLVMPQLSDVIGNAVYGQGIVMSMEYWELIR